MQSDYNTFIVLTADPQNNSHIKYCSCEREEPWQHLKQELLIDFQSTQKPKH